MARQHQAQRPLNLPHELRLPSSHPCYREIVAAHERALATNAASYLDPATGLQVLTAGYLLSLRRCCGNGCRHCPYVR